MYKVSTHVTLILFFDFSKSIRSLKHDRQLCAYDYVYEHLPSNLPIVLLCLSFCYPSITEMVLLLQGSSKAF